MRLDWILLAAAAPYAALVVGMALCLYLFVSVKRDLRASEERSKKGHALRSADCGPIPILFLRGAFGTPDKNASTVLLDK